MTDRLQLIREKLSGPYAHAQWRTADIADLLDEVADLRHLLSVATEVARERADTIAQMRSLIARADAYLSLVRYRHLHLDPYTPPDLIAEVDSTITALRAVPDA
jgi:hypothetical protein